MTAQEQFQALLRDHLGPTLRDQGFRRTRATFRRRAADGWQIVDLQKDKWATRHGLTFTVNLGTTLDSVSEHRQNWKDRGWPLEWQCDFRIRLAALDGIRSKTWEPLRPHSRLAPIADKITDDLERAGLPWLDLYSDPSALLALVTASPSLYEADSPGALLTLAKTTGDTATLDAARHAVDLMLSRRQVTEREAAARHGRARWWAPWRAS